MIKKICSSIGKHVWKKLLFFQGWVLLHLLPSCRKPGRGQPPSNMQQCSIWVLPWSALVSLLGSCFGLDQECGNWDLFWAIGMSDRKTCSYLRVSRVLRANSFSCRHITAPFPKMTSEYALCSLGLPPCPKQEALASSQCQPCCPSCFTLYYPFPMSVLFWPSPAEGVIILFDGGSNGSSRSPYSAHGCPAQGAF